MLYLVSLGMAVRMEYDNSFFMSNHATNCSYLPCTAIQVANTRQVLVIGHTRLLVTLRLGYMIVVPAAELIAVLVPLVRT